MEQPSNQALPESPPEGYSYSKLAALHVDQDLGEAPTSPMMVLEPVPWRYDPAEDPDIKKQYLRWEMLLHACELEWTRRDRERMSNTEQQILAPNVKVASSEKTLNSTSPDDPINEHELALSKRTENETRDLTVKPHVDSPADGSQRILSPVSNSSSSSDNHASRVRKERQKLPESAPTRARLPIIPKTPLNPDQKNPKEGSSSEMHRKTKGEHEAAEKIMSNAKPRPGGPCAKCMKAYKRYLKLLEKGKVAEEPQCLVSRDGTRTKCARCTKSKEKCVDAPENQEQNVSSADTGEMLHDDDEEDPAETTTGNELSHRMSDVNMRNGGEANFTE